MRAILILMVLSLCACGPKEIGEGSADAIPSAPAGYAPIDSLRLPMYGTNNTQKLLYWINRPDVMQNVQSWQRSRYRAAMGLAPGPDDPAYREAPKQRSPFRQ